MGRRQRTAELLIGARAAHPLVQPLRPAARMGRDDAPPEAEGSSYYRHFYMGLLREDGTPKPALEALRATRARPGPLPVVPLRGPSARRRRALDEASWACVTCAPGCHGPTASGPNALDWFDRQMEALDEFDVTVTFCFTPEHRGIDAAPHQPAAGSAQFAEFCGAMIRRYAPRGARSARAQTHVQGMSTAAP